MKRTISVALTSAVLLGSVLGSTAAHAQGKQVVIGMGQEPDRLLASGMLVGTLVQSLVYDALVNVDDRMQTFAGLAADIPTVENGGAQFIGAGADRFLRVTMPLKQGVTWSDGTPFTADDVVYMFGVVMNPQSGFDVTQDEKIKSVSKVDDYTVQIDYLSANEARAKNPTQYANQGSDPVIDPQYFFGLNIDKNFFYPRHRLFDLLGPNPMTGDFTRVETSELSRNPVGTGPYVLTNWEPGVAMTFQSRGVALPNRLGRPNIDTVIFRFIPSKDTALASLEAGEIQFITQDSLDVGDSQVLDNLPNARGQYIQGTTYEHVTLNLRNPILADKSVRQAIAFGLNRQELVDVLLFGKSEPLHSQVPTWSWAYNDDVVKYTYNPGEADRLLTTAGWTRSPSDGVRVKNGQRLSLKLYSTGSAFRPRSLPLIKNQLAQIGVEVNIETVPATEFLDTKASTPRSLSAGQFDMAEFAWVGGYDPGVSVNYNNYSKNIPTRENGYAGGNYSAFRHGRVDQLLEQGQSSLDQGFRRVAYGETQAILMDEVPVIPLFLRPITIAHAANMVNVRGAMSSAGETWNVEQWDIR